ncbi:MULTISPECIES: SCO0607 family lipoprotein [unclassified Streptomyces]|uniref:SCO0607 family lipoprotein n=1 Tax=unclassified Streptomyces TaxID=2593676 RepID=UPI00381C8F2C
MQKFAPVQESAVGAHRNRASRASGPVLAVTALIVAFLGSGCSMQDSICSSGEYPVKAVGSTSGGACVSDGEKPPEGYVRYPKGKVPQHVDDKWDKYWNTVVVDKNGDITKKG